MINIAMDSQVLTSLQTCPRMTDYRFNKTLIPAGGKSNSLECGSLAHYVLEYYYRALIAGSTRQEAMATGFKAGEEYILGFKDSNLYIRDVSETGLHNTPEENEKGGIVGWKWVLETMEQYFEYWKGDNFTPLEVEHVLGKEIYADDEMRVIWKAKFDLIADFSNGIMPTDHKTSKANTQTSGMNNQFMGQCLLTGSRTVMINKIGFQTSLPSSEKFKRVLLSYSADRLHEWQYDIVPHYARMLHAFTEAGNFPPQFTGCVTKYGKCNYLEVCEADRNIREDVIKMNFVSGNEWDITND